ncbi:MAG TPA: vWA domain-containing protein [Lachnospiraceae bacterium]|nr:vWA domain-containing protein [Lachnospiraceae bacterium]
MTEGGIGAVFLALFLGAALILVSGTLFQWIYGLGFGTIKEEPTSYVFAIDDSGSMEESDPDQKRYQAIAEILKNKSADFPYAVYEFSSNASLTRKMAPRSDGGEIVSGTSYGGTAIRGTLTKILEDYKNGTWDGGDQPKIIMLTDGYATDVDFFHSVGSILGDYAKSNITISTVGLGNTDDGLMKNITESTGGIYVSVDEVSQLENAMQSAAIGNSTRDLVTVRYMKRLNALYAALRILFLTILGCIVGFAEAVAYGQKNALQPILLTTGITSLAGALIMELGCGVFHFPDKLLWLILWILFVMLIAPKTKKTGIYTMVSVRGGSDFET